jgi:PHD/YefM family antitoxin component YafN of YafNO toxin-antitoxin module
MGPVSVTSDRQPRTVQSSELSRSPASVFAAADQGPVTITRRDGEALILTRASEVEHQRLGLQLAAQLIAASLADSTTPFVDRLRVPFPWLEFLSATDRTAFAAEVVDVARACAAVSQFDRLLETLTAWRATAEAVAAGYTHDDDLTWLLEPTPVPDPREA